MEEVEGPLEVECPRSHILWPPGCPEFIGWQVHVEILAEIYCYLLVVMD